MGPRQHEKKVIHIPVPPGVLGRIMARVAVHCGAKMYQTRKKNAVARPQLSARVWLINPLSP